METRSGAQIVFDGDVVRKLHRAGTNPALLTQRLRIAEASEVLLSPLSVVPEPIGDRWQTSWPRVETLAAELESVPWSAASAVLAKLHTEPVTDVKDRYRTSKFVKPEDHMDVTLSPTPMEAP